MSQTRNEVQLVAYADRLAGDIPGLAHVVRRDFAGWFGGVHVLPFFTPFDGADAGFDPVDHTAVDPRLGTWDDIRGLSRTHDVIADIIVNHVSADSEQFRDVVEHGESSPSFPMFLTMSSVFPSGATEDDLTGIYRPRPGVPFTPMSIGGRTRYVWTTFTANQIDIDVNSEPGRAYITSVLDAVAKAGVTLVRLDAIGYAVKTPGTSCFMTPASYDFIRELTALARARGVEVLVEVHSYVGHQIEIGSAVDRVYDFALPPLVLHAMYTGDGSALARWFEIRPSNAITVLDTHDGIGIIDVAPERPSNASTAPKPGLLDDREVRELVAGIADRCGGTHRVSSGGAESKDDIYQVNATYYDALGRDDRRYLAARAIQFFTPGIPQVYYVGALAGINDVELAARSGVNRDINRHHYSTSEREAALRQPVVQALGALCRFRNQLPAFDGELDAKLEGPRLTMVRRGAAAPDVSAMCSVDLATGETRLSWSGHDFSGHTDDLLANPPRLPAS